VQLGWQVVIISLTRGWLEGNGLGNWVVSSPGELLRRYTLSWQGWCGFSARCWSWVPRQQTQPRSTTCVPRVVFRGRHATAGRFPVIADIPTEACPPTRRMPVLAADGWAVPQKPNCYPLGKAARSTMHFEDRNYLYVVGEWDEGRSGLRTHTSGSHGWCCKRKCQAEGEVPLQLPKPSFLVSYFCK